MHQCAPLRTRYDFLSVSNSQWFTTKYGIGQFCFTNSRDVGIYYRSLISSIIRGFTGWYQSLLHRYICSRYSLRITFSKSPFQFANRNLSRCLSGYEVWIDESKALYDFLRQLYIIDLTQGSNRINGRFIHISLIIQITIERAIMNLYLYLTLTVEQVKVRLSFEFNDITKWCTPI